MEDVGCHIVYTENGAHIKWLRLKLKKHSYNEFAMELPRIKYFGGKIVPHSDPWAGTTMGDQKQKDNCNKVNILHCY
jgi:hypothetical protein